MNHSKNDDKLVIFTTAGFFQRNEEIYNQITQLITKRVGKDRIGIMESSDNKIITENEEIPLQTIPETKEDIPRSNYDLARRIGCVVGFTSCLYDDPILDDSRSRYLEIAPILTISGHSCAGKTHNTFNTTHYHVKLGENLGGNGNTELFDYHMMRLKKKDTDLCKIARVQGPEDITDIVCNLILENNRVQETARININHCEKAVERLRKEYANALAGYI